MIRADRFGFVAELSAEGRATLAGGLLRRRAPAGRLLVRKGDKVAGAYLVEHGLLRVYALGPTGKEQTLYWWDQGSHASWR